MELEPPYPQELEPEDLEPMSQSSITIWLKAIIHTFLGYLIFWRKPVAPGLASQHRNIPHPRETGKHPKASFRRRSRPVGWVDAHLSRSYTFNISDLNIVSKNITFGARPDREVRGSDTVGGNQSPQPGNHKKSEAAAARSFACPFPKHNPGKYQVTKCNGPGWPTVSRVKEHVYRNHLQQQNICPRCGKSFESRHELHHHAHSVEPCEPGTAGPPEGIDLAQHKALKCRKRTSGRGKLTEEQQWSNMYAISFPDDKLIPSPYVSLACQCCENEPQVETERLDFVSRWSQHAQRALPTLMRPRLYDMFDGAVDYDAVPVDQIINITQDVLDQLIESFRGMGATTETARVARAPGLEEDEPPFLVSPSLKHTGLAEATSQEESQGNTSPILGLYNNSHTDTTMAQGGQEAWYTPSNPFAQDGHSGFTSYDDHLISLHQVLNNYTDLTMTHDEQEQGRNKQA